MRNFMCGVIVGTVLTTLSVYAAGNDGTDGSGRPPHLNEERERQFQFQLEQMRKQTEQEQARMRGQKTPC